MMFCIYICLTLYKISYLLVTSSGKYGTAVVIVALAQQSSAEQTELLCALM